MYVPLTKVTNQRRAKRQAAILNFYEQMEKVDNFEKIGFSMSK